jgi:hypothetical protein
LDNHLVSHFDQLLHFTQPQSPSQKARLKTAAELYTHNHYHFSLDNQFLNFNYKSPLIHCRVEWVSAREKIIIIIAIFVFIFDNNTLCVSASHISRLKVLFCVMQFHPKKKLSNTQSRWFFYGLLLLLLLLCAKTRAMRWGFGARKKKKIHDNNWHRPWATMSANVKKKDRWTAKWRRRW